MGRSRLKHSHFYMFQRMLILHKSAHTTCCLFSSTWHSKCFPFIFWCMVNILTRYTNHLIWFRFCHLCIICSHSLHFSCHVQLHWVLMHEFSDLYFSLHHTIYLKITANHLSSPSTTCHCQHTKCIHIQISNQHHHKRSLYI